MYQSYGGSNFILMWGLVAGLKMKWCKTGQYQFMLDRFELNASMTGI